MRFAIATAIGGGIITIVDGGTAIIDGTGVSGFTAIITIIITATIDGARVERVPVRARHSVPLCRPLHEEFAMLGKRPILYIAATMMLPLLASAPSAAAPMHAMKSSFDRQVVGSVEQIARRCRYDKHGRLRCRGAHYRSYRRYYYNPYAYYGYYPRHWGFGHYNHHGFGHGHSFGHGHHHGHH